MCVLSLGSNGEPLILVDTNELICPSLMKSKLSCKSSRDFFMDLFSMSTSVRHSSAQPSSDSALNRLAQISEAADTKYLRVLKNLPRQ